ncbi:MAG: MerR family transcriptional regulator [Magnetococcales bacterium]|nr:MerR family transcriptional regulator [Magnetococcales bacterium]
MNTNLAPAETTENTSMVKIGVVAKRLGISIRTIHMYERERLFISHKNRAGTRLFNEEDVEWLIEIRRMIKASISIAGIRSLLSLIPCWDVIQCHYASRTSCPALQDNNFPCWSNKESHCFHSTEECRACRVYAMRFRIRDFKGFTDIRMKSNPLSLT